MDEKKKLTFEDIVDLGKRTRDELARKYSWEADPELVELSQKELDAFSSIKNNVLKSQILLEELLSGKDLMELIKNNKCLNHLIEEDDLDKRYAYYLIGMREILTYIDDKTPGTFIILNASWKTTNRRVNKRDVDIRIKNLFSTITNDFQVLNDHFSFSYDYQILDDE